MNTPSPLEGVAEATLDPAAAAARPFSPSFRDVRQRIDDRARRGWTESSRRLIRGLLLLVFDLASGVIGVQLLLWTWPLVSAGGTRPKPDEIPLLATVFFLLPLALHAFRGYEGGRARKDFTRIAGAVTVAAALGWAQARLFGRESIELPNKTAYLYAAVLITALVYASRHALDQMIRAGFRSGRLQRRLLVIGPESEAVALRHQCEQIHDADVRIVGNFDPLKHTGNQAGTNPLIGPNVADLDEAARRAKAHGVLIVSSVPLPTLTSIMTRCFELGLGVSLLPRVLKQMHGNVFEMRITAAGPLLQIAPLRFDLPQLAIKRTMDAILTVTALILVWPVLLIVAIAVKLDSKGPILFSQVRAGLGGKPFRMFKFRTMRVGADEEKHLFRHLNEYPDDRLFKIKSDPRVTRIGKWLRRSSLDELPQLFNVLRGDMSLVGPRPCVPEELRHYSTSHQARLFVMPGLTGPWQVSGRNQILDFERVVQLETEYIESWSITTDLLILLKTIPAVFRGGAY